MAVLDPIFPQQLITGSDDYAFKMPLNCLFNPIYLINIIKNSYEVTIPKIYRPDLACKDYNYSSKYIKVVNIINGKEKGIFSYDVVGEQILAPEPGNISTSVSEFEELNPPQTIKVLPYPVTTTFKETAEKFNEIVSTSANNLLYNYVAKTSQETLISGLENTVKNLYEGILP